MSANEVNAIGYARVSSLLGQDPELQLETIRNFSKNRGFKYTNEYCDRISGTKEKRPALDQLLKDAQLGKFKIVIVVGIDRLARDTRHLLNLLEELRHYGVSLISIRESLDFTTPMGRASLAILGAVASLERDLISERIKSALAAKKLIAQRTGSSWRCGRPAVVSQATKIKIETLRRSGTSIRSIASELKLSIGTVHRSLKVCSKTISKAEEAKSLK